MLYWTTHSISCWAFSRPIFRKYLIFKSLPQNLICTWPDGGAVAVHCSGTPSNWRVSPHSSLGCHHSSAVYSQCTALLPNEDQISRKWCENEVLLLYQSQVGHCQVASKNEHSRIIEGLSVLMFQVVQLGSIQLFLVKPEGKLFQGNIILVKLSSSCLNLPFEQPSNQPTNQPSVYVYIYVYFGRE